jgi:hypothetical protein
MAMLIFGCVGTLATGSRMLWAFAREDGVPDSRFVSKIESRTRLPLFSSKGLKEYCESRHMMEQKESETTVLASPESL